MAQGIEDFLGKRLLDIPNFPGDLEQQREAVAAFFDRFAALSEDAQDVTLQLEGLRVEPRLADRGVAIAFRDPTFSLITWRLYAQLFSSDLCGPLPTIRLVVRAIEADSDSGGATGVFDESRWKQLRADLSALAEKARAG